jgi:recombination protein RecA
MKAAYSKAKIEFDIASRFGDAFKIQEKAGVGNLSTGILEVDTLTGGVPRGAITEIFGPASSGRTSFLLSMLAFATTHDEICALVDTNDVFAPTVATTAGIDLDRLLWIRCGAKLEHAFKATDLLLHAGGFGLIILDIGDVAGKDARRIISSWWYRFRRTVENRPTAIIVVSEEACTRSCASLTLELNGVADWSKSNEPESSKVQLGLQQRKVLPMRNHVAANLQGVTQGNLLRRNSIKINRRRPLTPGLNESQFTAENFL